MALDGGLPSEAEEAVKERLREKIHRVLGRSLQIREVDAGSCNGCEVEITGLNGPIYDAERLGIRFVASPRHADMLLVTGPVTCNMEIPLKKAYNATPEPRLVVAVGACGCSGGIFGCSYASYWVAWIRSFRSTSTFRAAHRRHRRCCMVFCWRSAGCSKGSTGR